MVEKLKIEIEILDLPVFLKLKKVLENLLNDGRISEKVKNDYKDDIYKILEKNKK